MFCRMFRYRISSELDSELNLSETTLRHIASCQKCRDYYEKLKTVETALANMPEMSCQNYNISRLNNAIYSRLDKCCTHESINIQYPTVRYNNKIAVAAVMFIAAILSISVYVNMTDNTYHTHTSPEHIATATPEKTEIATSDLAETIVNIKTEISPVFINPQMAILYQMTTQPIKELSKLPYQEQYKESLDNYEKIIKVTVESTEILNTVVNNNLHLILF